MQDILQTALQCGHLSTWLSPPQVKFQLLGYIHFCILHSSLHGILCTINSINIISNAWFFSYQHCAFIQDPHNEHNRHVVLGIHIVLSSL